MAIFNSFLYVYQRVVDDIFKTEMGLKILNLSMFEYGTESRDEYVWILESPAESGWTWKFGATLRS